MIALPPLAQGTTFAGEYRILEQLSHTPHLALYGAAHVPTGEIRVLEVLFSPIVPGAAFRDRFVRAALETGRAASQVIPRVFAAGIDNAAQVPFIAYEPFRGEVLSAAAQRGGGLPGNDAIPVLGQLALGIGQLHSAGIVHGGLRPESVILGGDPMQGLSVKVLNAGLGRVLGDARMAAAPSAPPCDPAWAAPEQILGSEATLQSDVYSFAMLAFTVFTGHRIWRGSTEAQIVREATTDALPIPTMRAYELGRGGSLPTTFDAWFARCAARNPQERFATVVDAFADLQSAIQRAAQAYSGSLGAISSGTIIMPPQQRQAKSSNTGKVVLGIGIAMASIVALGIGGQVAYSAVVKYRERAAEAQAELQKAAEAKTTAADVPAATESNSGDAPSIDISNLPSARNSRDRRDPRRDARRDDPRPEPKVESRPEPKSTSGSSGSSTSSSPAAAAEAAAGDSSPASLAEGKAAAPTKLQIVDISKGNGPAAKSGDKISVRYVAKRQDTGSAYDTSHSGSPFAFQLGAGKVTKGWEQGIPGMKVGGKRRLTVPPSLAYGDKGLGSQVPPNTTLIFDIELVSID